MNGKNSGSNLVALNISSIYITNYNIVQKCSCIIMLSKHNVISLANNMLLPSK